MDDHPEGLWTVKQKGCRMLIWKVEAQMDGQTEWR